MVSEVWYTNNGSRYLAYRYSYRADGQIHSAENAVSGKISLYEYDLKGRLVGEVEYDKSDYYNKYSVNAEYDVLDRITHKTSSFDYAFTSGVVDNERVTTYYYYTDGNTLGSGAISSAAGTTNVSYSYNNFKQLTGVSYDRASFDQSISLAYLVKNGNRSALVSSFTSTAGGATTSYSYTYDNYGNITSITSGGQTVQYKYDGLKRLTREDNPYSGTSTRYYYAENGNILRKDLYSYTTGSLSNSYRTYSYTYGNSDFGDQLTAYDGNPITYDALGNPLSYYNGTNYTFTWTGRQLTTAKKGTGSVISYEYNASGMRTSKTVGGAKTLYFYDGDILVGEMNTSHITVYLYSPDDGIAGMQVRSLSSSSSTWTTYWYEKNLQGDIVAIYGANGTKYVNYSYDAWGNHTPAYSNGGGSITAIANNPFRYRSYYYDNDLGLYYLGSRYYDPAICRFINMDAIGVISATPMALTDKNLYAYCDNNPVMRVDHGGEFWNVLVGGLVGAGVSFVSAVVSEIFGDGLDWQDDLDNILISTGIGAVEGAAMAMFPGSTVLIGMLGGVTDATLTGIADGDNVKSIAVNSIISGAFGAIGGAGGTDFAKGGKLINDAFGSIGNAIGKGVHPAVKKAANKTIGKAFKYTAKSFSVGVMESISYDRLYDFSSWYVNILIDKVLGR